MKNLQDFVASLLNEQPEPKLSAPLKSLWYDGKGDWNQAHQQVDQLSDLASAGVHAYLHRKEGDLWNADYWYKRAGKVRPEVSLKSEWEQLIVANL